MKFPKTLLMFFKKKLKPFRPSIIFLHLNNEKNRTQ
jgi:hypothetical protein